MANQIEHEFKASEASVGSETLPDDLEALLAQIGNRVRASIILPPGCGKILLGLTYLHRQESPCLVVASDGETAERWAARWRTYVGEPVGKPTSLDPKKPAYLTVTDHETLRQIHAEGETRILMELLRERGVSVILVEEAYGAGEGVFSLIERLRERVPALQVLGLSSRPPYDLPSEERMRAEQICGRVVAAAGVPIMVQRGILRPHKDFLYLCDPELGDVKNRVLLRRMVKQRTQLLQEALKLPFMGDVLRRLGSMKREYLYCRRDEVRALTALLAGREPRMEKRLSGLLGERTEVLTDETVSRAIGFLLASQVILSEEEKAALREIFLAVDEEKMTVFPGGEAAWHHAGGVKAKTGALSDIIHAEEAVLGRELRGVVVVRHDDAAVGFAELIRHTEVPVARLSDETDGITVYLPDANGVVERFQRLCRAPVDCRWEEDAESRRYALCRPTCPDELIPAMERLFEAGDIRILLTEEQLPLGCALEGATNLLILTSVTERRESGELRYAEHAFDWRGRVLPLRRDASEERDAASQAVHVWHVASMPGEGANLIAHDIDERAAVVGFLRCVARRRQSGGMRRPAAGETERRTWNADVLEDARRRSATVRDFLGMKQSEEPRVCAEVPSGARVPVWTAGRLIGLGAAALGVGVGGYLLPHLVRLTLQAQGMPAVLMIFLVLVAMAAGMLTAGIWYGCLNLPYLIRHRTAQASVRSLSRALLRALKEADAIGPAVDVSVEAAPDGRERPGAHRRLMVRVHHATFGDADCVCRALVEMLSPLHEPRYLVRRIDRSMRRAAKGKRGSMIAYACPSVLAVRDSDAEIFAACLCASIGRLSCVYTRRGYGVACLGEVRARGYIDRMGRESEMYVTF